MVEKGSRNNREVFRHIIGNRKVVSAPRHQQLFANLTISINGGLESRSTMLPASLAACVPLFIHSHVRRAAPEHHLCVASHRHQRPQPRLNQQAWPGWPAPDNRPPASAAIAAAVGGCRP